MAGTSPVLAAYKFKQAFFTTAREFFKESHPELEIVRGLVGASHPSEYVQILGTTTDHDAATMGSNRTREETVTLETQWFVFRYGEVDADQEAEDYLFARLGELEQHIRVTDITLGGVVRQCLLSAISTDSARIEEAGTSQGRVSAAIATWEAPIRIRNP